MDEWLKRDDTKELRVLEYKGLDPVLEKKTWTFLRNRIQLLLSVYTTSLEEDLHLLKENKSINTNKQLAIKMRVTEKKILTAALEYATQRFNAY